jgi:hypothetical protein
MDKFTNVIATDILRQDLSGRDSERGEGMCESNLVRQRVRKKRSESIKLLNRGLV